MGFFAGCLGLAVLAGSLAQQPPPDTAAKVANKVKKAEAGPQVPMSPAEQAALKAFRDAVAQYAALHAREAAKLGTPRADSAAGADAKTTSLAAAIVAARQQAKQGDIFTPAVQPVFRRLLAKELQGPDTGAARSAVVEGNPQKDGESVPVKPRVNTEYPSGAALSTVPASVLATLPVLPAPLQYRFVGRDLILFDSVTSLIVDFLPAGTPPLPAK